MDIIQQPPIYMSIENFIQIIDSYFSLLKNRVVNYENNNSDNKDNNENNSTSFLNKDYNLSYIDYNTREQITNLFKLLDNNNFNNVNNDVINNQSYENKEKRDINNKKIANFLNSKTSYDLNNNGSNGIPIANNNFNKNNIESGFLDPTMTKKDSETETNEIFKLNKLKNTPTSRKDFILQEKEYFNEFQEIYYNFKSKIAQKLKHFGTCLEGKMQLIKFESKDEYYDFIQHYFSFNSISFIPMLVFFKNLFLVLKDNNFSLLTSNNCSNSNNSTLLITRELDYRQVLYFQGYYKQNIYIEDFELHEAIFNNNIREVFKILSLKNKKVIYNCINETDTNNNTPLMLAIKLGYYDCLEVLTDHGVDITLKPNKNSITPIEFAIIHKDEKLLLILLTALNKSKSNYIESNLKQLHLLIKSIPNFTLELELNVSSTLLSIFNMSIPNDRFVIYKQDGNLRIDMNISKQYFKGIKGKISLLFVEKGNKMNAYLINHDKKVCLDFFNFLMNSFDSHSECQRILKDGLDVSCIDLETMKLEEVVREEYIVGNKINYNECLSNINSLSNMNKYGSHCKDNNYYLKDHDYRSKDSHDLCLCHSNNNRNNNSNYESMKDGKFNNIDKKNTHYFNCKYNKYYSNNDSKDNEYYIGKPFSSKGKISIKHNKFFSLNEKNCKKLKTYYEKSLIDFYSYFYEDKNIRMNVSKPKSSKYLSTVISNTKNIEGLKNNSNNNDNNENNNNIDSKYNNSEQIIQTDEYCNPNDCYNNYYNNNIINANVNNICSNVNNNRTRINNHQYKTSKSRIKLYPSIYYDPKRESILNFIIEENKQVQTIETKKFELMIYLNKDFPLKLKHLSPIFYILSLLSNEFQTIKSIVNSELLPFNIVPLKISFPIGIMFNGLITIVKFNRERISDSVFEITFDDSNIKSIIKKFTDEECDNTNNNFTYNNNNNINNYSSKEASSINSKKKSNLCLNIDKINRENINIVSGFKINNNNSISNISITDYYNNASKHTYKEYLSDEQINKIKENTYFNSKEMIDDEESEKILNALYISKFNVLLPLHYYYY